jgi:hypothetical protein
MPPLSVIVEVDREEMTVTEIDPDLIENLRKALDAHTRTGSYLELLSAASEIVVFADAEAYEDRDGEVWVRQPSGEWLLDRPRGVTRTLEYVNEHYGPLKPVRR